MEIDNTKPAISVIVPVYKVEKYLTACLESIINQTLENIEIIVVDEGDKDRCREIIDYYQTLDKRIIAPHRKNGGYGASCNLGLSMARGDYIAIAESDDVLLPNMYEVLYKKAIESNADVVKTPYYEYFTNGERRDCYFRHILAASLPENKCFSTKTFGVILGFHASIWSALYKASYLKEKGIKFVEAKGGAYVDASFRFETLTYTDRILWVNRPLYLYRVDAEGSDTNNFNLPAMTKRWREVHELANKDDWERSYGKYMAHDEFFCSISKLADYSVSRDVLLDIQKNWQFTSNEQIEQCYLLRPEDRKLILAFKQNPFRVDGILKLKTRLKKIGAIVERNLLRKINCPNLTFLSIFGLLAFFINEKIGLFVFLGILILLLIKISCKFMKNFFTCCYDKLA